MTNGLQVAEELRLQLIPINQHQHGGICKYRIFD
jgi:hypothetical protein